MSDVINLASSLRLEPKRSEKFCRCARVFVVEDTRMLECQSCGKIIDPFDFLMKEARQQQSFVFEVSHLKNERKRLEKEVDDLKRIRRNLKSQVSRASNSV